jgi:hypothetical protein
VVLFNSLFHELAHKGFEGGGIQVYTDFNFTLLNMKNIALRFAILR